LGTEASGAWVLRSKPYRNGGATAGDVVLGGGGRLLEGDVEVLAGVLVGDDGRDDVGEEVARGGPLPHAARPTASRAVRRTAAHAAARCPPALLIRVAPVTGRG